MSRVAVVTGGTRGIGAAVVAALARSAQFGVVVYTGRGASASAVAGAPAGEGGAQLVYRQVDMEQPDAVAAFATWVLDTHGHVDTLVNNAGVFLDAGHALPEWSMDVMERTMRVNAYAPLQLMQRFVPAMAARGFGRVINVSSGMGHAVELQAAREKGSLAYRASNAQLTRVAQATLNALTQAVSNEYRGGDVQINAVCPGFVLTDMTRHLVGAAGVQLASTDEGADTIVWLALRGVGGDHTGKFYRARTVVPW